MSRRRNTLEMLVGHLFTLAVLSTLVGLLVGLLAPWPPSVALWLSGFTAGLIAAPLIRAWLGVLAVRLSRPPTVPTDGATRTGGRTRRGGR
ncbi:hypothetical protein AB0F17_17010 [Nonomuraea sp. NPDC026600]|uniref:hypothetical protein n=1 Tax=Nonomuraea sp. NPDC026600 TaxID=3155363 RepID=UPI0033D5ACB5